MGVFLDPHGDFVAKLRAPLAITVSESTCLAFHSKLAFVTTPKTQLPPSILIMAFKVAKESNGQSELLHSISHNGLHDWEEYFVSLPIGEYTLTFEVTKQIDGTIQAEVGTSLVFLLTNITLGECPDDIEGAITAILFQTCA
jgi:hypothetical protein